MAAVLLHGLVPAGTDARTEVCSHHMLACDGFTALLSSIDDPAALSDPAPEVLADLVSRHNAILVSYCTDMAVLPMRFGAAFSSADVACAQLQKDGMTHRQNLATLGPLREFTVRLSLVGDPPKPTGTAATGRDFLAQRRATRDRRRSLSEKRADVARRLLNDLHDMCRHIDAVGTAKPGIMVNTALLINLDRLDRLKEIARSSGEVAENLGLKLSVTGPWPAYSFQAWHDACRSETCDVA